MKFGLCLTPTDIQKKVRFYFEEFFPFVFNRTSIQDDEHSGDLKTATTDKIVTKINIDGQLQIRELADVVNISTDRSTTFYMMFWVL